MSTIHTPDASHYGDAVVKAGIDRVEVLSLSTKPGVLVRNWGPQQRTGNDGVTTVHYGHKRDEVALTVDEALALAAALIDAARTTAAWDAMVGDRFTARVGSDDLL